MAKKFLFVLPNPYIHIDHDGYPAGACPCDRMQHVGETVRAWVGAELDREQTKHLEKLSEEERRFRDPIQQTRFKFNLTEPTMLPVTPYYQDRVRGGELFPADAKTALLCGVDFIDPKKAMAASKLAAIAEWERHFGKGETPEHIDVLDGGIGPVARFASAASATARAISSTQSE